MVDWMQLILYLICHSSWDIRKVAHDATRKIISALPLLSEALLLELTRFLSNIGESAATRYYTAVMDMRLWLPLLFMSR